MDVIRCKCRLGGLEDDLLQMNCGSAVLTPSFLQPYGNRMPQAPCLHDKTGMVTSAGLSSCMLDSGSAPPPFKTLGRRCGVGTIGK
jgi:hypothetical protein